MPKIVRQRPTKKRAVKKKAAKTGRAASKIVPVGEWEGSGIKINLYGRNGTGKTTLACTFPKPLLLVGFEDGTKSVKKVPGVFFAHVKAGPTGGESYSLSEIGEVVEEAKSYKTVVLDTVTSLQDVVLCELLGLDELPSMIQWGTVTRDQYRQRSERTREFMRLFLSLGINVVALAQEKDHTNKEEATGDEEILSPFIASNLGIATCGWLHDNCDYICQTFIRQQTKPKKITVGKGGKARTVTTKTLTGKSEYCLRTLVHTCYACKLRVDRGTEVPDVIIDPTFDKLNKLIEGE